MIKPTLLIFVVSVIVVFIFGMFVGSTSLSINEQKSIYIDSEKQSLSNQLETETINIEKFTSFQDESQIAQKRSELINFLWHTEQLPIDLPNLVETNFTDSRFDDLQNLRKIEKLSIFMKDGFHSHPYIFLPETSNGKLILYHQGHSGGFVNGKQIIQAFLNSGFSVAAFSMPLIGLNNQPTVQIENFGPIQFFKHNQLILLDSDEFSSMNYFFTPINITLNHLIENYSFDEYHMVGISGGGWASTVYPAIDTRISKSFSVAGSLPLSLRNTIGDVGDYEQYNKKFYSILNYFELYIMSSYGQDREFTQIFNKYDPCCFAGNISENYYDSINDFVSNLSSGNFNIIFDDTHSEHKISDFTIDLIIKKLS
jgi:hypothetical protein